MKSVLFVALLLSDTQSVPAPQPFDLASRTILVAVHATGAQIYECRLGNSQSLSWAFREPIAALTQDGKTIGRHYLGPTWAFDDGSLVTGKQVAALPGPSTADITQLKIDVVLHSGRGRLDGVAHVYRVRTVGGTLTGPCKTLGALQAAPYAADYLLTN